MTKQEKKEQIHQIFSPSAPVENINLFFGREKQIEEIEDAVLEKGQHIVMFGKRGAGKTSLANITGQIFENIYAAKITCNRNDNYISLWNRMLQKIQYLETNTNIGFEKQTENILTSLYLPDKDYIDVSDIENMFVNTDSPILLIFDEFDSIKDEKTKVMIADTIKAFSDNINFVTIFIIGIAQNVKDLIGWHPSLERCIKQINLPLMSNKDAKNLIKESMSALEIEIPDKICTRIIDYASGFPHYLHLLSKFVALNAIENNSKKITDKHFNSAVFQSIESSDYTLQEAYTKAIKSAKNKNQFEDIIYACAAAQTDEDDTYSPETILKEFNKIRKSDTKEESIRYNLGMLCKKERGLILEKAGSQKERKYRFRNPLMRAFVKLKLHIK